VGLLDDFDFRPPFYGAAYHEGTTFGVSLGVIRCLSRYNLLRFQTPSEHLLSGFGVSLRCLLSMGVQHSD